MFLGTLPYLMLSQHNSYKQSSSEFPKVISRWGRQTRFTEAHVDHFGLGLSKYRVPR